MLTNENAQITHKIGYFGFECTWLFQKRIVRIKLDIYVFITITGSILFVIGLLVPEVIIHLVVSVSAKTWNIRYIFIKIYSSQIF
jgi:hypothetical protein